MDAAVVAGSFDGQDDTKRRDSVEVEQSTEKLMKQSWSCSLSTTYRNIDFVRITLTFQEITL